MLWLGVHFPLLPLEVFTAGRVCVEPLVVIHDSRVVLRNAAAIEAGIGMGSTLATAHSIAAGIRHYRRAPERELDRLTLLAEVLYGFSARVSLVPSAAGVVLEIGGSLKLFGDVDQLAQRARALCHDLGHEVRIRWAATPLAAVILARADVAGLGEVPLSQAAVEPGQLTPEHIERFANMGIHDLEQLLALPSRGVAHRFGKDLLDYLARLTGERPDPRPSICPPERFHSTLHLLEPLDSKEALIFPMQRLLIDLQHWLVARQLGAEQLRWYFSAGGSSVGGREVGDHSDAAPTKRRPSKRRVCMPVRFARAQQRREAFLEITRLQMADMVLPEEVISLELEAPRLVPWSVGSRGLFHNQPGMHSPADELHGLHELVDQLRARLGRGACYSLEVQEQHLPERAWAGTTPQLASQFAPQFAPPRQPSGPPRKNARKPATKAPAAMAAPAQPRGKAGKRPLWLFDPPRAIGLQQLTLLRGPERIHTGWWLTGSETATPSEHPQGVQAPPGEIRDYYVARHRNGAECWVFVDPQERWFLHGYFA